MKLKKLPYITIFASSVLLSVPSFASMNNQSMQEESGSPIDQKMTMVDTEIKSKITTVLSDYSDTVDVLVKDNVVYLSGKLPSDTDYEKVVTLVESIKGVRDVNVGNLTVKDSEQPLKDSFITAKIKGNLIKKDIFDKDIPSWTIGVETKNNMVYLSGEVKSVQEKNQVLEVVKSVKDIKGIDDQIIVNGAVNQKVDTSE